MQKAEVNKACQLCGNPPESHRLGGDCRIYIAPPTEVLCIDEASPLSDWTDYLTPAEQRRLQTIEAAIANWKAKRETLRNRAKLRRHRAQD